MFREHSENIWISYESLLNMYAVMKFENQVISNENKIRLWNKLFSRFRFQERFKLKN